MVLSKDIKIAICFGLIIGALISVCNMCFAAESENISYNVVSGLALDNNNNGTRQFVEGSLNIGYIRIEPGYEYTFTNGFSGSTRVMFGDSVPAVGDNVQVVSAVPSGSSYTFRASEVSYLYFDFISANGMTIARTELSGLTGFVDNMAYSLSIGDLSQVWVLVVPIIAISVLLGLGFYLLKRLLNRIKRAKGGV